MQLLVKQQATKKFFVTSEYRGLGVAQKLLFTLAKNAVKHGFEILFLGTVDQLHAAKRFYEKIGFQLINKKLLPKEFEICPLDRCFYMSYPKELEKVLINVF